MADSDYKPEKPKKPREPNIFKDLNDLKNRAFGSNKENNKTNFGSPISYEGAIITPRQTGNKAKYYDITLPDKSQYMSATAVGTEAEAKKIVDSWLAKNKKEVAKQQEAAAVKDSNTINSNLVDGDLHPPSLPPTTAQPEQRESNMQKFYADGHMTHADRAKNARQDSLDNSHIDTAKTPEMLRSEYFQRLADIENNRQYWRPGIMRHGLSGSQVLRQGGAYQMPAMQSEDTRQQEANRQRHMDKAAFEELQRWREANNMFNTVRGQGELNMSDLERTQGLNRQQITQLYNQGVTNLELDIMRYNSGIVPAEMLQKAAADIGATVMEVKVLLAAWQSRNFVAFNAIADRRGMSSRDIIDNSIGHLAAYIAGVSNIDGNRNTTWHQGSK